MSVTVVSIRVGLPAPAQRPRRDKDNGDKTWITGFGKHAVPGPIRLRRLNLDGDAQADLKHHGGPDKAVCVYPAEHYACWRNELRVDMPLGAFGENITVSTLTESDVCIGDVWQLGEATVQVSQPRQPCWKLSRWWGIDDLAVRVQQTGRTGWYLRVLAEGMVEAGSRMTLVQRMHPGWTVAAANEVMHRDKSNIVRAGALAALGELSESWRATLTCRIEKRTEPKSSRRLFGDAP